MPGHVCGVWKGSTRRKQDLCKGVGAMPQKEALGVVCKPGRWCLQPVADEEVAEDMPVFTQPDELDELELIGLPADAKIDENDAIDAYVLRSGQMHIE